ncbi:MAG: sigma-70 family RNA polymerase sigma factor [Pseudomonadota bacterium]
MAVTATFRTSMTSEIPALRAFALSLCGRPDMADDLVQEALMKAWAASTSFTEGTNMRAWLFTILRNHFFTERRKRKREVQDSEGKYAATLATYGNQLAHLDFTDFQTALEKLSDDQREVLVLIGASGFSYEEAAEICNVAVGTIKSRLNRARIKLSELLGIKSANDIGPDPNDQAALGGPARRIGQGGFS